MNNPLYSKFMEKKTLSSRKRRMKIVHIVLAVHLAILFLPLSYFLLMDHLSKLRKKDAVVVRLVELPKDGVKTVKKPSNRRTGKKAIKNKKKTQKRRVQKKVQPKTATKKSTVKPTAKPRSFSTEKVVKSAAKIEKTPPAPRPSIPDDLELINDRKWPQKPQDDEEETDDDGEVGATYTEQLVSALYKMWTPPSNKLLNGRKPKVYVKIRFNRFGRVLEKKITKKSDFIFMNRSVEELLKSLTQLPPPPPGEPTEIEFVFVPQE